MTRSDREVFPHVEDAVGEDPARFLDRELLDRSGPIDATGPLLVLSSRINGIDRLEVIGAWQGVEERLLRTPDRGRSRVKRLTYARAEYLEEHGTREDQLDQVLEIPVEDDVDEIDEEEIQLWRHVKDSCGSLDVEQESGMAWFCRACGERTNRVEEVDPDEISIDDLPDAQAQLAIADGGSREGSE